MPHLHSSVPDNPQPSCSCYSDRNVAGRFCQIYFPSPHPCSSCRISCFLFCKYYIFFMAFLQDIFPRFSASLILLDFSAFYHFFKFYACFPSFYVLLCEMKQDLRHLIFQSLNGRMEERYEKKCNRCPGRQYQLCR